MCDGMEMLESLSKQSLCDAHIVQTLLSSPSIACARRANKIFHHRKLTFYAAFYCCFVVVFFVVNNRKINEKKDSRKI